MLGKEVCTSLVGLHAYTGCDTVGAFSGLGKIKELKMIQKEPTFRVTFGSLDESWDLSPVLLKGLEAFTCQLYSAQEPKTWKSMSSDSTYGELRKVQWNLASYPHVGQHARRGNYQCAIWKRCLENSQIVSPPEDNHGWVITDQGKLQILWITGAPAPDVEFMSCKCLSSCEPNKCPCLIDGLRCTPECRLQDCGNMKEDDIEED
jgi:hypothetical protein